MDLPKLAHPSTIAEPCVCSASGVLVGALEILFDGCGVSGSFVLGTHLNQDLSVSELASIAQISSYYFGRLFKRSMNMTPYQYLIQCRLEQARRLLRTTDLPVAEIASRTGFSSHSHLTTLFKKQFSVTPSAYRRQL